METNAPRSTTEPVMFETQDLPRQMMQRANDEIKSLRQRVAELEKERDEAFTVMVAAAEEISAHWEAHCDEEGYGPANLMHRLEHGIATLYPSYTAGAFAACQADAARYRWLRDQDWEIKRRVPLVVRFDQFNNSDDPGMNLDVIDAAIDKAMEG